MSSLKVLVCGNHTCGNRGDAAILRGLMNALEAELPGAEFKITSRYPTSSSFLMKRQIVDDIFANGYEIRASRIRRRVNRLVRRLMPWILMVSCRYRWLPKWFLPSSLLARVEEIRQFDLVVQAGGSYFVDLYGYGHFEVGFCACLADVPVVLLGHSIGPMSRGRYPWFIGMLLRYAAYVGVRESISSKMLAASDMPMEKVNLGADTAWLVDPNNGRCQTSLPLLFPEDPDRPVIAITTRVLAPFDKRLGIKQADYEAAFVMLVKDLICAGYNVIALSTCTGIDGYKKDDRMVALRIGKNLDDSEHYRVVMDEVDDLELGNYLQHCHLLVATRLHSAIIAMNFGTPALVMAYEHKSTGILCDMNLGDLSVDIRELIDGSLTSRVLAAALEREALAVRIAPLVSDARNTAHSMVVNGLKAVGL